ncbi:S8 family peptidase [Actinosynnema pretiosum subsp. pretiosum]|uniref:S8 family peptidase n=1 Tax=Actinosynnema pretiosum subsp. pretiosum TaxID=103721 RepID=A0AA45R643_9PSEU|nr:putative alkaline serine protease [Actinosynnema pretiosum subsp. pretiosum]QUF06632.1 S8 family peptidase [Actinosynnema pretiosum subsp. pretiosum]
MSRNHAPLLTAALAVVALATPASAEEGRVLSAASPDAIPGSFLVQLKPTASAADFDGSGVRAPGVRAERVLEGAFHGFTARLTDRQARRLAAHPDVELVEQDQVVRPYAVQTNPPWHLDRLDQVALPLNAQYGYTTTGQGTRAYVVDTGVRITHQQFGGRICAGWDVVENDEIGQDLNGHGTHVAGLIAGSTHGVAKSASICPVRVFDANGSGTTAGVVQAVNWIRLNAVKPATANFSLGGAASTALDTAVQALITSGVTASVTAGGSNGDAANHSPARVAAAITSGATTNTDARAPYSNYGSIVDVYAPGQSITSAWHTSDTATNTLSGTSMSTAQVTGVANRYLHANPTATPAQVHGAIVSWATPQPWGGKLLHWPPQL